MEIVIIAMVLVGLASFMALQFSATSQREIAAQVRRANRYAITNQRDQELAIGLKDRIGGPLIEKLSTIAMRISPQSSRLQLARKLHAAGVRTTPQTYMAIKLGVSLSCFGLGFLMAIAGKPKGLLIGLIFGVVTFLLADFWLARKQRARSEQMSRDLPDTLDLLTVTVEAGLGFDSAIAKVVEKMEGPLVDEFETMAREMRVGESRREALRNLAGRVGSEEVRGFCRSIIQADELGASLGRTLRVQSVDMRVMRQLAAEEKAMKAPVKMLFPTVLFIFPAMFTVILGPAGLNLMDAMKNA